MNLSCGIEKLSEFFANQGCDVLCVDGLEENIQKLCELYPDRIFSAVDLETAPILKPCMIVTKDLLLLRITENRSNVTQSLHAINAVQAGPIL
jgi:hypothetical protein